jgi:hypothetical protein
MPRFGRKTIKRSVDVVELFLKAKGFLDDHGRPTAKSEGMLSINPEGETIILKTGEKKFDKLMRSNTDALTFIGHLPYVQQMKPEAINETLKKNNL